MSHSDFSTGRHLGLLALSLRLPAGAAAPTEPAEISLGYARDCSHRAGGHVPGRRVLCRASPLAGRLARPSRPFHRSRLSGTPAQCLPPALRLQASRPVNCLWLQKVQRLHSSFRWDLNPLVTCAARRTRWGHRPQTPSSGPAAVRAATGGIASPLPSRLSAQPGQDRRTTHTAGLCPATPPGPQAPGPV